MPTFGSLFAGIAGFDEGLRRAGWECAFQVELDPFCQRVLQRRFPGVERAEDVRTFGGRNISGGSGGTCSHDPKWQREERDGAIDLLVGGFPCQDLSVAGKRAGLGGERSGLFWEIVRIAHALKPTWGLFENVPGLLSSHRGRDFWLVLSGLRECWPAVGWRVLDSRHFGVAQRRRRVFIVCGPTEAGVAAVLTLGAGGAGDLAAGGEAGAGAAVGAVYGVDLARALRAKANLAHREDADTLVSNPLMASKGGSTGINRDTTLIAAPLSAGSHDKSHMPGRRREDDVNLVVSRDAVPKTADGLVTDLRSGNPHPSVVLAQCHGSNVGPMGTLKGDGSLGGGVPFVFEPKASAHQSMNPARIAPALGTTKEPAVFHALTGEGHDASEDGSGRGTPLVAFDTTQITSKLNYSNPKPGDPCHPLAAGMMHAPAIAFNLRGREEGARVEMADQASLRAASGGSSRSYVSQSAVRRLTPVECERLQAFPDGWTCLCQPIDAYTADPDGAALACTCPDSPRYRALGNAVTVSVIHALGERLMEQMR